MNVFQVIEHNFATDEEAASCIAQKSVAGTYATLKLARRAYLRNFARLRIEKMPNVKLNERRRNTDVVASISSDTVSPDEGYSTGVNCVELVKIKVVDK